MNKVTKIILWGGLLILIACKGNPRTASLATVKTVETRDSFIEKFSAFFESGMSSCHCPGASITIVQDSTVRWMKGFGVRSVLTQVPVDEHTIFRLASVSKNFASIITQIYVDRNALSWEDKVTHYLPEFGLRPTENTELVTIRNIISHTSGLPYHSYTNLIESGASIASIISLFKNIQCKMLPGNEYAYQNASYAMIEPILLKATGKSYPELLHEVLIDSLHMPDINYNFSTIHESRNVALPHRLDPSDSLYIPTEITDKFYNAISAGGINASITDMSIWLKLLLGNYPNLISKEKLDTFFKPIIRTTTDRRYYNYWPGVKDSYYAKGMRILDYGDHHKYYHAGYANEYRAEIAIDPRYNLGICILFNSTCHLGDDIIPDFFKMNDDWLAGCR
ncbi:MAG: serine hydrolase domain-containing protein [Saprospiraceae bacterium]